MTLSSDLGLAITLTQYLLLGVEQAYIMYIKANMNIINSKISF